MKNLPCSVLLYILPLTNYFALKNLGNDNFIVQDIGVRRMVIAPFDNKLS